MMLLERLARSILVLTLAASCRAWGAPYLALDVSLDPATRSLAASASITSTSSVLSFYLAEDFVVQSVEVEGATVPADRNVLEGLQRFEVQLPDAEKPQTVTVRYHGELKPLDTTLTHDQTLAALPAMASSEGSYLPGSSSWHPMLETAFTYRLKTSVPEGHIVVAPGAPSDEASVDGIRRASFTMKWPVDSIDMMVGKWSIGERRIRVADTPILLRTYFGKAESALGESYLDATERFVRRYSRAIGPYPYTAFSVVSSPIPTGFGMPTLTYLGKQVLAYPFIRDISLGHEVLHSWWGNGVRVDPLRGNWAEGLTTFMADYAYREDESVEAARRMRHGWLRDYAALSAGSERPLSAFRARHHSASAAIGYGKAAMMFYALRARIGKQAFDKGIQIFWKEHQHASASFEDLREAFEQAAGSALADFFKQWLDRTGAPLIGVTSARLANGGRGEVRLELTQDTAAYNVSVPLRFFARDKTIDARVKLSAAAQQVSVATELRPTAVQVDPQFEVWRRLYPEEAPPILRDVIAAQSVQVTALAEPLRQGAGELAGALSEGSIKIIDSAEHADPNKPLIIAGALPAINNFLRSASLAARPEQISAGAVEMWMVPDTVRTVIVVAVQSGSTTDYDWARLGQRLRHFGRYSWVSIGASGETARGNWAVVSPRFEIAE